MKAMYLTIKKLYLEGRLTESGLNNAVSRGWITAEERTEIKASK